MYPLALDLGDGLGQRGFALPVVYCVHDVVYRNSPTRL